MKNAECIECGRPLFDQNTPDDSNLCDECYAFHTEEFDNLMESAVKQAQENGDKEILAYYSSNHTEELKKEFSKVYRNADGDVLTESAIIAWFDLYVSKALKTQREEMVEKLRNYKYPDTQDMAVIGDIIFLLK